MFANILANIHQPQVRHQYKLFFESNAHTTISLMAKEYTNKINTFALFKQPSFPVCIKARNLLNKIN
jgi:hypothetical protein